MIENQTLYRNQSFALYVARLGQTILQDSKEYFQELYESGMTVVKDNIHTMQSENVLTKPGSYITEVLNTFILQCHQHGIFQHLYLKYIDPPIVQPKDPKKVLTMYMLSAGFYLWLISISVACIVFVIEHIVRYFSRTRHLIRESEVEIFYDELEYDVSSSSCGHN